MVECFQPEAQCSYFSEDPDKMPLEEGRFIPKKIHLSVAKEPHAHIRAVYSREPATVLLQIAARFVRALPRLPGRKFAAGIQTQQQ